MDTPFQFADYVTGKYFIGRRSDCITLSNLLTQGESIAIWSPLKSGKMSAVQQTLLNMRTSGKQFLMCSLDLTNIHDAELFIRRFAGAVISSVSTVPQDYQDNASKYLSGTSLEFDAQSFSVTGRVFSDNAPVGAAEISAVAELPFRIAEEKNVQFIIVLNEFENIDSDEGEKFSGCWTRRFLPASKQGPLAAPLFSWAPGPMRWRVSSCAGSFSGRVWKSIHCQ